jgi:hypothetical protein
MWTKPVAMLGVSQAGSEMCKTNPISLRASTGRPGRYLPGSVFHRSRIPSADPATSNARPDVSTALDMTRGRAPACGGVVGLRASGFAGGGVCGTKEQVRPCES